MKLLDTIVLNGLVGYVDTNDDNDNTIGVLDIRETVTFKGDVIVDEGKGFPLTKEMEARIGWRNVLVSIKFVISDNPINPLTVDEDVIKSYYGEVSSEYVHVYSAFTGYLWTDEGFKVGGHDIIGILSNYIDKYIHMEIEIYRG